ncbi:MAG: hypothetical protein JO293_06445 [Candidatus Eremiobacteraeota bacterium]|nr:hypothetical protein [Candidatus Eremiobacteraeota bacterium]
MNRKFAALLIPEVTDAPYAYEERAARQRCADALFWSACGFSIASMVTLAWTIAAG